MLDPIFKQNVIDYLYDVTLAINNESINNSSNSNVFFSKI